MYLLSDILLVMSAMWNWLGGVKFGYIEVRSCALQPWCMPRFYLLLLGPMVKTFSLNPVVESDFHIINNENSNWSEKWISIFYATF